MDEKKQQSEPIWKREPQLVAMASFVAGMIVAGLAVPLQNVGDVAGAVKVPGGDDPYGTGDLNPVPCPDQVPFDVPGVQTNLAGAAQDLACDATRLRLVDLEIATAKAAVVPTAVQGELFTIIIDFAAGKHALFPVVASQPVAESVTSGARTRELACTEEAPETTGGAAGTGRQDEYTVYPEWTVALHGLGGVSTPQHALIPVTMRAPMAPTDIAWDTFTCHVSMVIPYTYVASVAGIVEPLADILIVNVPIKVVPNTYVIPLGKCLAVNSSELTQEDAKCTLSSDLGADGIVSVPLQGVTENITYSASLLAEFQTADSWDDDIAVAYFTATSSDGDIVGGNENGVEPDIGGAMAHFSGPIPIAHGQHQGLCGGIQVKDVEQEWDLINNGVEGEDSICVYVSYENIGGRSLPGNDPCLRHVNRLIAMEGTDRLEMVGDCTGLWLDDFVELPGLSIDEARQLVLDLRALGHGFFLVP